MLKIRVLALVTGTLLLIGSFATPAFAAKRMKPHTPYLSPAKQAQQETTMWSHLRFNEKDKAADAAQPITQIWAVFDTNDDDKDKGVGIDEQYHVGNHILGQNYNWGADLNFRDHSINWGQTFDISSQKILAKNVNTIKYSWHLNGDDDWNVGINIFIRLANGNVYQVGGHYFNIHKEQNGDVDLGW